MDMINHLGFKLIDPVEAEESWALDGGSQFNVVEIYIDGREICDVIKPIEEAFIEKSETSSQFDDTYGHLDPKNLYDNLSWAAKHDPYFENEDCLLLCCETCGEPECWSIAIKIKKDKNFIYWYDFEHNHEGFEYGLSYIFEKNQYDSAMRKLRKFISQQMR